MGSGEAIELGARGEADVVLAHSPAAEEELMAAGKGASRRTVMHNDFVLVGPGADPAGVRGDEPAAALAAIADAEAPFISRGDESGTHTFELGLWEDAGVEPGRRLVPGVGSGHGRDAADRERQGRVHPHRSRDLPRDGRREAISRSSSRAAPSCSTSTT